MLIVAVQAGPPLGALLSVGALLALALGLSLAAGYQVLARRERAPEAYRGPSPVLVFAALLAGMLVVLGLLAQVGLVNLSPLGIVVGLGVQVGGYLGAVWLFAIRSGALSWADLDLGRRLRASRLLGDVLVGAAIMLPATFGIGLLTRVVFELLDVPPPQVVPVPEEPLLIALVGVMAILIVPVGEEVFFRGFALTAWLRDLGARSAIVRSALFFAVFHIINTQASAFDIGARQALGVVLVILPVGAIFGVLFVRRGLAAAIAAHATYNALGYLARLIADSLPAPPA